MPDIYTVRLENLMLDQILVSRFGLVGQELVDDTLRLNPGLAALGPILPLGTKVVLPERPTETTRGIENRPVDLFT